MKLSGLKVNLKIKNLILFGCFSIFIFSLSHAQEKEVKKELKEQGAKEVEITEKIEITNQEELDFIPFAVVDNIPYPLDCKSVKAKAEKKKCVVEFLQQHTIKNFNTGLGTKLGLPSGKKRILVLFKFDKSGKVIEVKARGPHPEIEKEAERVVKLLPDFIPGEHQGEIVVVAYSLPIMFSVPAEEKDINKQ
ncbi:hypothetical protein [Winogradskyella sp.]|uniref:hypothetical protein n=1 Tax=Winogradskyella sp. TaxID=1883156 RepID=UPI002619A57C|nr:hypothetical protein [Winogradskyella sp.]